MDNAATLNKMHFLQLTLADELKRICDKHGIRYFIFAGSLLGAVRHGGFIPWDDDMDFGMFRTDFDRFVRVCAQELDESRFFLQSEQTELRYPFNFAKLRLKGTHVAEAFAASAHTQDGISIDIFPLDAVAPRPLAKKLQFRGFWLFRSLLWVKCGYGKENQRRMFKYRCARLLCAPFPIRFLKSMKNRIISRYQSVPTEYVVTSDGTYGLKRETLRAEWIQNLTEYRFEDRRFPGIADYDAYLTYLYGDYMQLPPEEQRNHHTRLSVDFGPY